MMKKLLLKFWAPLLLFLLVLVLSLTNFSPNTFLTGWDNLHPELNPLMNLDRAWQSAWQEYQGLGLLAGMAHGADLFRQLILLPLTLFLPTNLFRYVWHFLMISTGVLSSFSLMKFLLAKTKDKQVIAFLGASFYLLNFATVQNFYVTFEPFAAFYAFLPLLLLMILKLLQAKKFSKKNFLIFVLISLISSSMFYVQTIFVVYLALTLVLFLTYFLKNKKSLKRISILLISVLLINSFWFLNAAHFVVSESALLADSKGKAMSNDVLILKNQAFGDLEHVFKMQGFWLGQTDFDQFGNSVYLFDAWKTQFSQPLVIALAWGFFVLALLGIWQLFRKKNVQCYFIFSASLLSLWMMALDNFPFKFLTSLAERFLPLFSEMFRINFTKWVVPYSLFYSVLVAFGLAFIFSLLKKKAAKIILSLVFFSSSIFYSWPSFQGNFFYKRLRVEIPEAYFELFAYFKNEAPQSSRIANLPQHTFYGWQWHDWGYRGSGFIWYGIKQPILDRAFDVWSQADERYYWQLQAALDKKDINALENVLAQYDVDYLLLDESMVNRNTVKPFNYQAIEDLLLSSEKIELLDSFDFIKLYTFADLENSAEKDFVRLYADLPKIENDYDFAWSDQAFSDVQDYVSSDSASDLIYPFSSLFTNHSQKDLEFALSEDEDFFYLNSLQKPPTTDFQLSYVDLLETEKQLPFNLTWQVQNNSIILNFKLLAPEIIDRGQSTNFILEKDFTFDGRRCLASKTCSININQQLINLTAESGKIDLLLKTDSLNTVALSSDVATEYFVYDFYDLRAEQLKIETSNIEPIDQFQVKIPKIILQTNLMQSGLNSPEPEDCRPLQGGSVFKELRSEGNFYQAEGASVCDHFYVNDLAHNNAYLIKIEANNLQSIPAVFAVQAESLGRSPIETYLSEGVNYQILPATEDFNQGYTLYFSTDSYGREINQNFIKSTVVYLWPQSFLKHLNWQQETEIKKAVIAENNFAVKKHALWLYQVKIPASSEAQYLSLSQADDQGWLAYQGGQKIEQQKFNNWANVWLLEDVDEDSTVWLIFWPQLLEYFGFLALILLLSALLIKKRAN